MLPAVLRKPELNFIETAGFEATGAVLYLF